MKLSRYAIFSIAAVMFLAVAALPARDRIVSAVDTVARAFTRGIDRILVSIGRAVASVASAVSPKDAPAKPAVLLVRTRDIVRRLIKRDAPRIESTWRLCPSI